MWYEAIIVDAIISSQIFYYMFFFFKSHLENSIFQIQNCNRASVI